ncbi:MAG: 50S ribosomal protein L6 [Candidatus Kerfeldbacteria bacterium]|nr:50S ribosomal protein L6 [Candidatus Kerfeldbacteria bacterium]
MPRIAKRPITIPQGVTVTISETEIIVKGAKGELRQPLPASVAVVQNDNTLSVSAKDLNDPEAVVLWGTVASHIKNMLVGVTTGFKKSLAISGVGYTWNVSGQKLTIKAGYSHPVVMELPVGITGAVEEGMLVLSSINKELLGETAANIRRVREPEPYQGSGIRYSDEVIRRKVGKAAGAA